MFMTVIAGIFFIITGFRMAGDAACLVITVKPEIAVMVKGCRFPGSSFMAIRTTCGYFQVKVILRLVSFVAR